jgi:hypothetical protein
MACAAALGVASAGGGLVHGGQQQPWGGVLDQHPSIQYTTRPTTDRVARLQGALAARTVSLQRDPNTGYLPSILNALGLPIESQLLVFSKTGVQRAYTSPHNPRALFYDESAVVGYVPGAPALEIAAHDPQQGVVFYTVDQDAAGGVPVRRTSCLACHVSPSTLDVPGIIVRSNTVGEDGTVMPQFGSVDVNHQTPHPDRWGGWFVTADAASAPYAQRAHAGNIAFSGRGNTSNQVFVEWMDSAPETRGYLAASSDIVSLLVFDHQMHGINLLTRLNWEARVAAHDGRTPESEAAQRVLVNELADYLLFVGEVPPAVALVALPGFAKHLESRTPKDSRGRSLAEFDLTSRLMRYPCSYLVYSEAFDGLPGDIKAATYNRMIDILSGHDRHARYARLSADDRRAVLEILRDTKPDFPRSQL